MEIAKVILDFFPGTEEELIATAVQSYKDIDAYDMPKEFKHLQAQDMGKVGAIQDLIRGIEKILRKEKQGDSAAVANDTVEISSLTGISPRRTASLKRP